MRACVVVPSLAHEEEELEQHAKKKACESLVNPLKSSRECGKARKRAKRSTRPGLPDTTHDTQQSTCIAVSDSRSGFRLKVCGGWHVGDSH